MPELLEDYKTHHAKIVAHARELQRLREQVRSTAEREAAAIVTNARRDVRKILLDARHELLVLVAQLQAVGCETQSTARAADLPGEAIPAAVDSDPFAPTREIVSGARRDMREVLLEARADLLSLADEARDLRAHVVEQRAGNPPESAPRAVVGSVQDFDVEQPIAAAVAPPAVPIAAARGRVAATSPSMHYAAAAPARPMWIAAAAALGFAAVMVLLLWWPGVLRSSNAASPVAAPPGSRAQTPPAASPRPAPTQASPAPAAATRAVATDPSLVSVVIDARRDAWIRTTIDGTADRGRLYAAGQTRTVTARQDVVLRVGDAGAVSVAVDGQPSKVLGVDGQVVTRRYAPRQPRPATVAAAAPPGTRNPEPGTRNLEPATAPGPRTPQIVQAASGSPAAPTPARVAAPPVPREAAPLSRTDVGTAGTVEAPPAAPARADATPIAPPARPVPTAEVEILNANSRWFEAYYAGDRATMQTFAAADFTLADERTGNRLAANTSGVQRSMDQIRVEVAGDGAVLSARLTERLTVGGETVQQVSMVSQVWIRQNGRWRLVNVRFIDAANLGLGDR
jgi:hypothetical protein